MSVTLEQAQICDTVLRRLSLKSLHTAVAGGASTTQSSEDVDAEETQGSYLLRVMRTHGVRREVVRLNVRRDTFAFNKLQRQFLPKELRPPVSACASGTT
eukprot:COSAG01_NODE_906_length_12834_cov_53.626620_8_plen_100_part_00